MSVTSVRSGWFKLIVGWALSFALRAIPFRPPNLEPILAVQMPFTRRFGVVVGFAFAFVNIVLFDAVTGKLGQWTFITAACYGLLAIFSAWYFRHRAGTALQYAVHAVYATLLYDAVTSLSIGPLFFGQSLSEAFFGQIPFTVYHLIGNIALGAIVSPVIFRWVAANPRFETGALRQLIFRTKAPL